MANDELDASPVEVTLDPADSASPAANGSPQGRATPGAQSAPATGPQILTPRQGPPPAPAGAGWAEPGLPTLAPQQPVQAPRRHRVGPQQPAAQPGAGFSDPEIRARPQQHGQRHEDTGQQPAIDETAIIPPVPAAPFAAAPLGEQDLTYRPPASQQQRAAEPIPGYTPAQPQPQPQYQAPPAQQQYNGHAQQQAPHTGLAPNVDDRTAPMTTATDAFDSNRRRGTTTAATVEGWRAFLNHMGINVGPSKKAVRHAELIDSIRASKDSFHATGIIGDASGATLLTGVLGQIIARTRPDSVVALDVDPEGGDLDLVTAVHPDRKTPKNARTLLSEPDLSDRNKVDKHLSTTSVSTNLHVLASAWRPTADDFLDEVDVQDLFHIFDHHYSVALLDAGRALQNETGKGVLSVSSALILVASATTRSVRRVGGLVDWLRHRGYHGLLSNTIVVINQTKKGGTVSVEEFDQLFRAGQKLRVHDIPFDPHLDADEPINLDRLQPATIRAFEELASMLAETYRSDYRSPQRIAIDEDAAAERNGQ